MQFSILRLKPSITWANSWSIDLEYFLPDGILQLVQITGFECVPPQEETTSASETLAQAMDDFKHRIENYIQQNGRHLNDFFIPKYLIQMPCLDL